MNLINTFQQFSYFSSQHNLWRAEYLWISQAPSPL